MKLLCSLFILLYITCTPKNVNQAAKATHKDQIQSWNLTDSTSFNSNNTADQSTDSLTITARIVGVKDGDTVDILYNGELQLAVRLAHIDAPEKRGNQPYWQRSKQKLSDLCFGQTVRLTTKRNRNGAFESDRNGRMIAVIYNDTGSNVNMRMIESGMAWHYQRYSEDTRYQMAEQKARAAALGLWNQDSPARPDDFRNVK